MRPSQPGQARKDRSRPRCAARSLRTHENTSLTAADLAPVHGTDFRSRPSE
jgi:hypothetical protein